MDKKNYIQFLKAKIYILIFIIAFFSLAGSLKGAAIESKRKIGVTQSDIQVMNTIKENEELSNEYPVFIGTLALAYEQNEFFSYRAALVCAAVGFFIGLGILALYRLLYYTVFWQAFLAMIKKCDDENTLFMNY